MSQEIAVQKILYVEMNSNSNKEYDIMSCIKTRYII